MAELHQAAKRFNVEDQIQDIVRTADPAKIDSTLEELKNNNEELFDINDNDEELVENKEKTLQDTCQCLLPETCPQDKVVYTFGKSCDMGFVRCCLNKNTTFTSTTTVTTTSTTVSTTTETAKGIYIMIFLN